jgi:hypothetical protein
MIDFYIRVILSGASCSLIARSAVEDLHFARAADSVFLGFPARNRSYTMSIRPGGKRPKSTNDKR